MTGTVAATRTISVTSATDILTLHGRVTQGAFNGAITKTGTGTLVLLGDNDYGGLTTVSTGMINIRHANALGLVTSGTSVAAGASLQIQGGITTSAEPLTLSGAGFAGVGGVGMQNGALVNVAGDNSFSGLLTLAAAATLSSDSGSLRLSNSGTIAGAGFGLTLTGAGDGRVDSIVGTTTGGVIKSGAGRWLLAGANTNTGTTTVIEGTLQLGDGTVGSWSSTPGLTFAGSGRFQYQGVATGSSQTLGALTFQLGDGVVQSSYGGESGDTTLTFASLAPRIVGGTGNFVIDSGVNGAGNKIVLAGQPVDGFLDQGLFFGGDSYAWVDAAGFVRGLDYVNDAGASTSGAGLSLLGVTHQQLTGPISAQETATFSTIKIAGDHALTLSEAQTLTVNGLLKTGGGLVGGTISGGSGLRAGLNTEMVVRVVDAADTLTFAIPVLANGVNGLTKSGAGTLVLHSSNGYTGPTTVAAGTLRLTGGGTLTSSLITVSTGGVVDLDGQAITNGLVLNGNGVAGVGALINSSGSVAQMGGITLAASATIGGSGDLISRGALVGLSPIRLFKVGVGMVTFGDNAGVAQPSLRTGVNQIDEGTLRINNSSSALGTVAAQLILNGGRISLGSATSVVAYPTAVTANSAIEADVYVPGTGLVHTLGTLAIGNQTLTITAGSNITAEGTNAGVTFGLTTLRGNPTFDVQNPTTAVGATTTLTLGALNDQGNAKTITFTNSGSAATNSIVTLATAAGSLMQGTVVTIGDGANAGVNLNLNIAAALGTLAQVSLDEKSVLNLGAAQTLGSLTGNGTVSTSGAFALTVGNANSSPTLDGEFTANLINGAGTLGFTKGGLGTLTLNPTIATYTGVTTVTGGVLKLGNANALGLTSGVTIGVESTIDLNGLSTDRNFSSIRGVGFAGMGAIINSSETTSTITGTAVLASLTRIAGTGNIAFNNQGGLTGNSLLTKAGSGTLTFRSVDTSARSGVNQIDEGVLRLESATGIRPVGAGVIALNGGTLSLGFDGSGSVGGAVNLLTDSTIIVERMTEGGEDLVLSLGVLGIGGNKLTVKAGDLVTNGSIGLTLGTTTIGGPALAPGNPVFDVQSSEVAVMHLRLGALTDQAMNPRTITFQNSGEGASQVTLGFAATSLINGTMVNLPNTGGSVRLNLDVAGALGQWAQVMVGSGNTLALGASQTLGGINGVGRVTASVPAVLTVGNALGSLPVDSVFEGVIEGGVDLSLVKAGTGTLTLGGAESNTFAGSGGLVVAGGTLVLAKTVGGIAVPADLTIGTVGNFNSTLVRLAGDHQIATTAKVVMNVGATLDVNGFSQSFGSLFGVAGSAIVNNASGTQQTVTFGVGNATGDVFVGSITDNTTGTGTLAVDKVGSGDLTLLGANRFSGPVNVTGGTLTFANESNLGNGALGNGINVDGSTLNYVGTGRANLGLNQRLTLGAAGVTVNVAEARGALVFAGGVNPLSVGNLLKTGPGLLALAGTTNLNGAALTVSEGVLRAGFGGDGIGSIAVGPMGVLDLSNGSAQALGDLTGLTLSGGSRLGFELDAATNDSLSSLVAASVAGTIVLDFFSVGEGLSGMTYPLISAPSGLFGGNFVLGQGINGWNLAINSTDSLVSVVATKLQLLYWRGGQDASWSALGAGPANWTLDQTGLVDAVQGPGFADTVVFSAASAPFAAGTEIVTSLDGDFLVDGLIFDGVPETVTGVTISPGLEGQLTLKPLSATGGIEVRANAGLIKITAPLTIGDAQFWRVSNVGASLLVEGLVNFQDGITKTGAGSLTLSGDNLGAGGVMLSEGEFNLNSPTALGTGMLTIGGGTVIDNTSSGPVTLANQNAQAWNGSFRYKGTQALNLGTGPVLLGQDVTMEVMANTLTVGGVIDDGDGTFGLIKTGAGTLVLAAGNAYQGATVLAEGALVIAADQQLNGSGNALVLGAVAGDGRAFSLDLTGASAVFGGDLIVQTENEMANTITIGEGQSLSLRGSFTMGYLGVAETQTALAMTGAGTFKIGEVDAPTSKDVRIGNGESMGVLNGSVLDLSGLAVFYAHLGQGSTMSIGDLSSIGGGSGQVAQGSSVVLAADSTLIAATLSVGGSVEATQRLRLGTGLNRLFVETLSISGGANDGASRLDFFGATGQLLLRDLAGTGRVQWNVQNGNSSSMGNLVGTVDFRGHSADLLVDVLAVGGRSAGTTGGGTGEFFFDTGVMDVTTVLLGSRSGDAQTTSVIQGGMTLGGEGAGSQVTLGTVSMSNNSASRVNSSGDAISTLNLLGAGTFNIGALNMGSLTVSGLDATSGTQATVNLSADLVTVGQMTMAVNAASGAVTSATTASSTLNLIEGALAVAGDISMGGTLGNALNRVDNRIVIGAGGMLSVGGVITAMGGVGSETVLIQLVGGTWDMQGGSVGSLLAPVEIRAESGTLRNLGEVNGGAGFSKMIEGTVVLEGDNDFDGLTVGAGELIFSEATLETDVLQVTSAALLGGVGSIMGDVMLSGTLMEPAILRPGVAAITDSKEVLAVQGALTLGVNSAVEFYLGQTNFTALEVETIQFIDSTVRFRFNLEDGYIPVAGSSFKVLTWSAGAFDPLHDWTANFDLPGGGSILWDTTDFVTQGILRVEGLQVAPVVAVPPQSMTVNAGDSTTFTVSLAGSEVWLIEWLKDDVVIPGANGLSYTIAKTEPGAAGMYRVRVVNEFGSATSDAATLTVRTTPVFASQPQGVVVIGGTSLTLQVAVLGPAPLSYVWKKDGAPVDGAPNAATYVINPVDKALHQGSYSVEVTNAFGMVESESAVVEVNNSPLITQQPQATSVPEGNLAMFAVTAIGDGVLTYQWRRNGVALTEGGDFVGTTMPNLQVRATVMTAVASQYSVVINGIGAPAVSQAVALTFAAVTVVVEENPAAQIVEVGAPIELRVETRGGLPQKFQWFRNGVRVVGAMSDSLLIPAATLGNAGGYTCVISNDLNTGKSTATSAVAEVAVVDATARRFVIREGVASPTMAVNAAGNGLVYAWYKNLGSVESPNLQLLAGAELRTFKPGLLAAGRHKYVCQVTADAGSLSAGENEVLVYNAAPNIVPTGWGLPATTVSAPYLFRVPLAGQGVDVGTGGTGEFDADKTALSFRAIGLPAGLQIDALGVISGRAMVDGTFNVTIIVSNAVGSSSFGPTPLVVRGLSENVIGEFVGPVDRDLQLNDNLGGAISVRTTKNGTYTGRVTLGARTFSFRGLLNPMLGAAGGQVVMSRGPSLTPLTMTFILDAETGLINRNLSGITDGVNTVRFDGWRFRWLAVRGAPPPAQSLAGYYTMGLDMTSDLVGAAEHENIPQGVGYAAFTVNASSGRLVVAGRLADGTAFTTATFAGPSGEVMVFRTLYAANARGSVVGQFKIDGGANSESADDNTLAGALSWWCPASPPASQRVYRAGFGPLEIDAVGGRYLAPLATALNPRVMGLEATAEGVGNAVIELTEGLVEAALPPMTAVEPNTVMFRVDEKNRAVAIDVANNQRGVRLSINAKTGAFSGQFVLSEAHPIPGQKPDPIVRRVVYQGLIVTGGAAPLGVGYFLLPKLPVTEIEKPTTTAILSGRAVFGRP
jgi:autotransporter-associated beta strand protein